MTTIALILNVMGILGFILFLWGAIPVMQSKGKGLRKDWKNWAVGQVLILPTATMNMVEENTTAQIFLFIAVLGVGIFAIYNLAKQDRK